jgi:hypothetical protein
MVNMNMIVNTSDLVGYEAEKTASTTMQRKKSVGVTFREMGSSPFKKSH